MNPSHNKKVLACLRDAWSYDRSTVKTFTSVFERYEAEWRAMHNRPGNSAVTASVAAVDKCRLVEHLVRCLATAPWPKLLDTDLSEANPGWTVFHIVNALLSLFVLDAFHLKRQALRESVLKQVSNIHHFIARFH